MSSFDFKLNSAGVRELLQSSQMQSVLSTHATDVRNRAGEGYDTSIYVGKNRANASVYASTEEAYKDNLENNTLLKALGV